MCNGRIWDIFVRTYVTYEHDYGMEYVNGLCYT